MQGVKTRASLGELRDTGVRAVLVDARGGDAAVALEKINSEVGTVIITMRR